MRSIPTPLLLGALLCGACSSAHAANTPLTETVGKGKTLVFRDGQVYEGAWERAKAWKPTTYTIGGRPAVLSPGQVWVALIGRDRPVTVR